MIRWYVTRPYAQRIYRAYCVGFVTEREFFVRRWFWFWRWS
jgi:RPA family protein